MFSRLASSSSARVVLRRSFASLPPTPPPAATSRRAVKLGTTFVAGLALGGYLVSSSDLARPVMLDSPVSTPKSTEEPIPSLPPSTESAPLESSSRIGQGPAVDGSSEADAGPASEFADVDTAGDSVGGSEAGAAKVQDAEGGETEEKEKGAEGGERDPKTMGAFNEETGEINWDCPCLGGMPHGPCGEQFRAAFSCFVYSEQEPKGIECVEKFKDMQECFRAHPDVYGESDYEDEDKDVTVEAERAQLEPLEKDLREEPSKPFKGEDDERGELFAQDGGVTGEGIGTHTE